MKLYYDADSTIAECSRILMNRYGNNFRRYGSNRETLERWSTHLSKIYGVPFVCLEDDFETIREWSKNLY